jgi:pimeloyl-ACP methyl ester carboxylesterase
VATVGAVAGLVSASRRSEFERAWEDLPEDDLPERLLDDERPAPPVHPEILDIEGPEGNLFVLDGGLGDPPVVLLHGLGGSSRQWQSQLDHLWPSRRALALDLRGHGDSETAPASSYDIEGFVADLAAVVDALQLDRLILAGHSLGASVALRYAALYPDRLAGLLLVDPNGDQTRIPADDRQAWLDALAEDPRGEMEGYFSQLLALAEEGVEETVLADLRAVDPEALVPALQSSFHYSPLADLEDYAGPVLAVISDMNDLPFSLHKLAPTLPIHRIVGASHWLMMDRPEVFNRALDDFLATLAELESA